MTVAVYCASSENIAPAYFDAARHLGRLLAEHGIAVVNGAGRMGLMAAVSNGALEAGGEAIGVIPQFMVDKGLCHPSLSRTIVTPDMHTRKNTMAELSDAVIALPGGVGTLEEIAEMMAWRKLGLFHGEVIILNINGFYDPLIAWLDRTVEEGFTYGSPHAWRVADTPEQAVEMLLQ